MKIVFYPEFCCEMCNDVIHNHMECPACKDKYAGTSKYGEINYMEVGKQLSCEKCKAVFKLKDKMGTDDIDQYEWERIYDKQTKTRSNILLRTNSRN